MKKKIFIIILTGLLYINPGYADNWGSTSTECAPGYARLSENGGCEAIPTKPTTVYTTEIIPGADCKCIAEGAQDTPQQINDGDRMRTVTVSGKGEEACKGTIEKRKYVCTVQPGLAGFQQILASIIRWFVYIVMLLGVLGIVGLGIAWSFSGGDDAKAKSKLKGWAINILIGLTILFLFRYILIFIAPWVYN